MYEKREKNVIRIFKIYKGKFRYTKYNIPFIALTLQHSGLTLSVCHTVHATPMHNIIHKYTQRTKKIICSLFK